MVTVKKTKTSQKITNKLYYNDKQRRLSKLVSGKSFDMFIMLIILADAVIQGMMTSPTFSFYYDNLLYLLDRIFMGIFLIEMFLKIFALKRTFFQSRWNIFDLIVIGISSLPFMGMFIVLRTFRILRLLKYGDRLPEISKIVCTFLKLLPTFLAFLGIFAIFFYIFAIIAVNLYGDTFPIFGSLGATFFTLLQIFTLDGWASSIARPVMIVYPYAWIFFSTLLLTSFLLVISFVATIITQMISEKKYLQK